MAERNHIRTDGYRVRTKRDAVDARCAAAMAQCHAVIGIAESKVAYGNGELAIGFAGVTCGYTCLTTRIAGEAHDRTSVTTRATIFTRGGAAIATGLATCAHGCTDLISRLRTAAEGAALCTRCQGHFIGIDAAVAVLVGPATHGGGALADGRAVIADRHAAFTDRRGAEAPRRGPVCRGPRTLPPRPGLTCSRLRTLDHGHPSALGHPSATHLKRQD